MAITNITTANTFGEWLSATQALVGIANNLTDGPALTANTVLNITHSGTTLNVANTALFTGNIWATGSGVTLNVANNIQVGGSANIQLLTGNCVSQFDPAGTGVAMAIALG